jgi:hypothetical protein
MEDVDHIETICANKTDLVSTNVVADLDVVLHVDRYCGFHACVGMLFDSILLKDILEEYRGHLSEECRLLSLIG